MLSTNFPGYHTDRVGQKPWKSADRDGKNWQVHKANTREAWEIKQKKWNKWKHQVSSRWWNTSCVDWRWHPCSVTFTKFPKIFIFFISREWIAPATATYMLGKLVETFANNDTSTCEARAIQVSVMVMADVVIVLIHRQLTHSWHTVGTQLIHRQLTGTLHLFWIPMVTNIRT